jgi:hypothetical protein
MLGANFDKPFAGFGRVAVVVLLTTGTFAGIGAAPAAAQFFDRPPGYLPMRPLPPEPIPDAPPPPWDARPLARPWHDDPPPGAYPADSLSRGEIIGLLARRGLTVDGPPRRRGDVYVVHAYDDRGAVMRLLVDAFDGSIVSRRVLASNGPVWGDDDDFDEAPPVRRHFVPAPPPESRRSTGEEFATREPAPLSEPRVIPAPPMPKVTKVPHPPARPRGSATEIDRATKKPEEKPAPVAQATPKLHSSVTSDPLALPPPDPAPMPTFPEAKGTMGETASSSKAAE